MANDLSVDEGAGPKKVKTRELSTNLHLPQSELLDADGNEILGQQDAVAWDLINASATIAAILKRATLLLDDIRAGLVSTTAVSIVRDLSTNAVQAIAIMSVNQNTTAAADTIQGNWVYSEDGGAVSSPANEYTVPSGKRLRVVGMWVHLGVQSGHTTAGVLTVTLRWAASGSISTSSPRLSQLLTNYGSFASVGLTVPFPMGEGMDFAAGTRIGASVAQQAWASSTNQCAVSITMIGRLYDDTP